MRESERQLHINIMAPRSKPKNARKPKSRGFQVPLYRLLKQVHPEQGISKKAMQLMNDLLHDVEDRIANRAKTVCKHAKRTTIVSRDVQAAVRLVLRGELAKHGVSEGTKAVSKFTGTN